MAPFVFEHFALVAGILHVANTFFFARIVRAVQLSAQENLEQVVGTRMVDRVTCIPFPLLTDHVA